MHYVIIKEETMFDLEKSVNKMMKNEWKPIGGPVIEIQTDQKSFYQAMIKDFSSEQNEFEK